MAPVEALLSISSMRKRFCVLVTCGVGNAASLGKRMYKTLHDAGIPATLIPDAAVAHLMDTIDMVIVGCEGVVENGGIINSIGTYQIGILAQMFKKPLYVLAESYKFVRVFPLNQRDLPDHCRQQQRLECFGDDVCVDAPLYDYTPPGFISLLITDLGVLTPAGVSEELIKLYL